MVVPKHIFPVVSLLIVLALGLAVELVLGGFSAGFAAAVAAQGAAGIRSEENAPALAAPAHEQPGIQNALAVVDESGPQRLLHQTKQIRTLRRLATGSDLFFIRHEIRSRRPIRRPE